MRRPRRSSTTGPPTPCASRTSHRNEPQYDWPESITSHVIAPLPPRRDSLSVVYPHGDPEGLDCREEGGAMSATVVQPRLRIAFAGAFAVRLEERVRALLD